MNLNAAGDGRGGRRPPQAIRRAHSATHLLHHALHRHLGKHAQQAGQKVEPDRLRFDFANPEAVGKERLEQIEKTVNALVMTGSAVDWTLMPIAEAKSLGAMALFGEKYPDIVRVVRMGDFSKELCGGTHLDNVGQVGLFKIIGEESVASGTRRITALTGQAALDFVRQEEEVLARSPRRSASPRPARRPGGGPPGGDQDPQEAGVAAQARGRAEGLGRRPAGRRHALGDATVVVQARRGPDSPDEMRVLIDGLRRKERTGWRSS